MNPLHWIDAKALRAADWIIGAVWYRAEIPRGMIVRICIAVWMALQIIRSVWLHGHLDATELVFMPVIFVLSFLEERRLLRVPVDLRNGYILVRRERHGGFRLVIAIVLTFSAFTEVAQPFPGISLGSDLFFWLYIYLNESLFPMGTPRRRAAKATEIKNSSGIHVPGWQP
jgi:hypothetical protein